MVLDCWLKTEVAPNQNKHYQARIGIVFAGDKTTVTLDLFYESAKKQKITKK